MAWGRMELGGGGGLVGFRGRISRVEDHQNDECGLLFLYLIIFM